MQQAIIVPKMPLGYGFHPTNGELVSGYLLGKVTQNPLPAESVLIQERNLYDEMELSEIFATAEDNTKLYFFTHLKKKTEKGSRIDRMVGKGTWRGVDKGMDIFDDQGRLVGQVKNLVYESKDSAESGAWNMKEFSLGGVSLQHQIKLKNCVLCVIKRKLRDPNANRRRLQIEEDVPRYPYANMLCHCTGVRFRPSRQELVSGYLLNKVTQNPLPVESVIVHRNLYSETELFDIFATAQTGNNLYFFTQLKKKSQKGSRINRTVGNGTWRAINKGDDIFDGRRRLIGRVRRLIYENKSRLDQDNVWTMKEYSLHGDSLQHQIVLKDYVLCAIKRKTSNPSPKRRRLVENEDFLNKHGDCLQNKNDEINAGEDELSVHDCMNCNARIAMALPGSCFEDFNNAATATRQTEGIGAMNENPQSLSLDEPLVDEAFTFFEDFATGWFGSYNDLIMDTNSEAAAAAGPQQEGIGTMYENPQSLLSLGDESLLDEASMSFGDFAAGQFGSNYDNLFNINNEAAAAAAPQQEGIGTMYEKPQSLSLDNESLLDEAPMFFRDFAAGRFSPYEYLFNNNNVAAAAPQQEGIGTMHGEDDRRIPKMKKN